jgi:predicted dithiol-disulfide oxidoreductase (DUF899 family)
MLPRGSRRSIALRRLTGAHTLRRLGESGSSGPPREFCLDLSIQRAIERRCDVTIIGAKPMADTKMSLPEIVSRDEWLTARKQLLEEEKAMTRQRDALNARRRMLPMVLIDKPYVFHGAQGEASLLDLFEGRRQLVVYHFMFDPEWENGCPGCTGFVNALGDLSLLGARDTTFALISRAPLAKLERYKAAKGWNRPWFSSYGSDFNYDFHVTFDPAVAAVEHNYDDMAALERRGEAEHARGESHGLSAFFRLDDAVFHSYSTFARGVEGVTNAFSLLDITPYGRQQDFEDSPPGWPQRPTYG